jgi:hypothetical protein
VPAIEHIKAAQAAELVDEFRKPVRLGLSPALGSDQIEAMQKGVGQPLAEGIAGDTGLLFGD